MSTKERKLPRVAQPESTSSTSKTVHQGRKALGAVLLLLPVLLYNHRTSRQQIMQLKGMAETIRSPSFQHLPTVSEKDEREREDSKAQEAPSGFFMEQLPAAAVIDEDNPQRDDRQHDFVPFDSALILTDRRRLDTNVDVTSRRENVEDVSSTPPHLSRSHVWLLSFPNSGASHAMHLLQSRRRRPPELRGTIKMRTSYQHEARSESAMENPFGYSWSSDKSPESSNPTSTAASEAKSSSREVVLIKSHCAGYCEECLPSRVLVEFDELCRSATRVANGSSLYRLPPYPRDLIQKTVLLMRNPFETLVSRMRLGIRIGRQHDGWTPAQVDALSNPRKGIISWCRHLDDMFSQGELEASIAQIFQTQEDEMGDEDKEDLTVMLKNLPCKTEWLRWTQWHNHAVKLLQELRRPVLPLYYEDVIANHSNFEKRLEEYLLHPAKQSQAVKDVFIEQHSPSQLAASAMVPKTQLRELRDFALQARRFVHRLATPAFYKLVSHYFDQPWIRETKVAWLLGFPNSGLSYLMSNTQHQSQFSTATNHGQEVALRKNLIPERHRGGPDGGGPRAPGTYEAVRPDIAQGPFLLSSELPPATLVLTKAQCYGFCLTCAPSSTVDEFVQHCARATTGRTDGMARINYPPAKLVDRVLIVVRNPFDVIVSRMLQGIVNFEELGLPHRRHQQMKQKSAAGLSSWCEWIDLKWDYSKPGKRWLAEQDSALSELVRQTPCHSEWIRLIGWQNHAQNITAKSSELVGRPAMNLFYENFTVTDVSAAIASSNVSAALQELFEFLQLPTVKLPLPFAPEEPLPDLQRPYWDVSQFLQAKTLCQAIASPATWRLFEHYFDEAAQAKYPESTVELLQQLLTESASVPTATTEPPTVAPSAAPTQYFDEESYPRMAWLISFPNSGTSYTMQTFIALTGATPAVNYAKEVAANRPVVPMRSELPLGPFLVYPEFKMPPKSSYVLTKTHCLGYCDACLLRNYTVDEFLQGCSRSSIVRHSHHNYRPDLVRRVIHLARHPLDNLVARKHLGLSQRVKGRPRRYEHSPMISDTPDGLLEWCRYLDQTYASHQQSTHWLEPKLFKQLQSIPCGGEIFRYVRWHNLAIMVTKQYLQVPILYVHYEDYGLHWNDTIHRLIEFWNVSVSKKVIKKAQASFTPGKSYWQSLYNQTHAQQLMQLVQQYASPAAFSLLRRYFTGPFEAEVQSEG